MDIKKGLNLDNNPKACENGEWTYALNLMYDLGKGELVNEPGNEMYHTNTGADPDADIVGVIPYSDGEIIFTTDSILWYEAGMEKCVIDIRQHPKLKSLDKSRPIRGLITRNWKNELMVVFSDGVNGNLEPQILNLSQICAQPSQVITGDDDVFLNVSGLNYVRIPVLVDPC